MKNVGVVGLGVMGTGIAMNLANNGFNVYIWNRTLKKIDQKGIIVVKSPKEVALASDIVFEVTANDKSSKSVWLKKHGILAGSNGKKVLVTCATLSTEWTDELIGICKTRKLRFVDMPMTGGKIGAETGQLTLLAGGTEKELIDLQPVLKAISKQIIYFGKPGLGMKYKLILNYLQAVHIVGFGEAMKMAKEFDMDLPLVANTLAERPGGVITNIARNNYFNDQSPTTFAIDWIFKDLGYTKKMNIKFQSKLLPVVFRKYREAVLRGWGKKDWTEIIKL